MKLVRYGKPGKEKPGLPGPTGHWLVTRDEIANVQKLALWLNLKKVMRLGCAALAQTVD